MARDTVDLTPIEGRDALVSWFTEGNKPASRFRIGTEHEKFVFALSDHRRLPYEGDGPTIRKLLEGLATRFGWTPVEENGNPIALVRDRGSVTLEPGGQFELSGAPVETLHETDAETASHLAQVKQVADPLGIRFLGLGLRDEGLPRQQLRAARIGAHQHRQHPGGEAGYQSLHGRDVHQDPERYHRAPTRA